MQTKHRPVVIAGNWKMYKTGEQAKKFISELTPLIKNSSALIYLAVPFTAIKSAVEQAKNSAITIGAQNMHDATEGAFTGEISASMLVEAGAKFVILGHSERRKIFNESDDFINKKMVRALKEKLQPILCIGETLAEREQDKTEQVLESQLAGCLKDIDKKDLKNLIIAYEPVWAIGTNQTATPEMAQEAHLLCRKWLSEKYGEEFAQSIVIQYGGSVKPENAGTLLKMPDIDGLLVGGASLTVESFSKIINSI